MSDIMVHLYDAAVPEPDGLDLPPPTQSWDGFESLSEAQSVAAVVVSLGEFAASIVAVDGVLFMAFHLQGDSMRRVLTPKAAAWLDEHSPGWRVEIAGFHQN